MFREDKSTQMAAQFIKLGKGKLKYIHLLKMMYVADKAMTLEWGLPITFDNWVSMPRGPVLSSTYDCIKSTQDSYWNRHIKTVNKYEVVVENDPGAGELSEAEDEIIQATFEEWGDKDCWDAVEDTHKLPEWEDPNGSSWPITFEKMLTVNGHAEDIPAVLDHIETQHALQLLGGRA